MNSTTEKRADSLNEFLKFYTSKIPINKDPQFDVSLHGLKHSAEGLFKLKTKLKFNYISKDELKDALQKANVPIDIHPITKDEFPRIDARAHYYSLKEIGRNDMPGSGRNHLRLWPYCETDELQMTLPEMPLTFESFCEDPSKSPSMDSIKLFRRQSLTNWFYCECQNIQRMVVDQLTYKDEPEEIFNDMLWDVTDSIEFNLAKEEDKRPFQITKFEKPGLIELISNVLNQWKEAIDNRLDLLELQKIINLKNYTLNV